MKDTLRWALHWFKYGTAIVLKLALLAPLLLGMVWVNYTVDCSGLFRGEEYERNLALALLAGENQAGYDQMNERELYTLVAEYMTEPYDTIALGSSRVLQLRQQTVGGSFLNCGMSNADYRDIFSSFYLFDKAGMLPKTVILCPDPGLLYNSPEMLHPNGNAALYNEFLTLCLGIDAGYVPEDNTAKVKALFSPSYFQGNVAHYFSGEEEALKDPEIIPKNELYSQSRNVKLGDGGVLYYKDYRNLTNQEKSDQARQDTASLARLLGFKELDPTLMDVFQRFVAYLQSKEINVVFLLLPYHPLCYNYAQENRNNMGGFFQMEEWLRTFAAENNVALYGSYNPFVGKGYMENSFFDGLHIKPEAIETIFPGVQQAARDIATGRTASSLAYGGAVVSLETAKYIVEYRYEIESPHILTELEEEEIDGHICYVLGRYESERPGALFIGRYAVAKDEGYIYRYDTNVNNWVIDNRF